jgi:isopenicillin-N N-acyltransferase-like protein
VRDGCTAFALLPEATAEGHLLMGQNWDWVPGVSGALLRVADPDGARVLGFTEAGIVGIKIGLNGAGVGLCINGMTTTDDDWTRPAKPFHLRCHEILRAPSFEAARAVVTDGERACTTNYLIAQAPRRVVDLEASPLVIGALDCADGCLVHANHFEDPAGIGVTEPPNPMRVHSRFRARRLRELLCEKRPLSAADVRARLRDHENRPNSVCRHEDESQPAAQRVRTLVSIVMDLDARRLWACAGPPCEGEYFEVALEGGR